MEPKFEFLSPTDWPDYELIDSGDAKKLERFGKIVVSRPEPQAIWPTRLSQAEWSKAWNAHFEKSQAQDEKGIWQRKPNCPEKWWIEYPMPDGKAMRLKISLSSFKHVGVFPEQAPNWDFIYQQSKAKKQASVLNLFAYTGGASLAARLAGADVTHVEAIKHTISWAKENMEGSGLADIRWMADDALAFVQREVRRGKQYDGIILDPPAYGRGPNKERWVLEESIQALMEACGALLAPNGFVVLNLYSLGYSPIIGLNIGKQYFTKQIESLTQESSLQYGELAVGLHRQLPLGTYFRFGAQAC